LTGTSTTSESKRRIRSRDISRGKWSACFPTRRGTVRTTSSV